MASFAILPRWVRGENLEQEETEITEGFGFGHQVPRAAFWPACKNSPGNSRTFQKYAIVWDPFSVVEVTPDKKVVWVLKDFATLGPATAVQILDDPGIPENPGDSEH